MARDGFKVFDSDMHVLEPVDLWERYMDGPWKHRAPRGTARTPMDVGVQVDGRGGERHGILDRRIERRRITNLADQRRDVLRRQGGGCRQLGDGNGSRRSHAGRCARSGPPCRINLATSVA